ncbi:MAG: hypothetical protein WC654_04375 [Patescibacteria group bacterium]
MDIPDYLHPNVAEVISIEFDAAIRRAQWAVVLGLVPKKDGEAWCVLLGANLEEGVSAFGSTPEEAIYNFDKAMRSKSGSECSKEAP